MALLIHPGLHKTGTSWLQERLFADRRLFNSLLSHDEIDRLIVRPHDFIFDAEVARNEVTSRRTDKAHIIDVISSEILVGNPAFGSRDATLLAARLREVAGPAKVLLTIRSQREMLRSVYQQYVKRGGALDIHRFLVPDHEPGYFGFDANLFAFHHYATLYERFFGRENVLVLPQEILAAEPEAFVRALLDFASPSNASAHWLRAANTEVGKSPPAGATDFIRFLNLWRPSPYQPGGIRRIEGVAQLALRAAYRMEFGSRRKLRKWNAAIAPHLAQYGPSNRIVQQFCPFDLKDLGYE